MYKLFIAFFFVIGCVFIYQGYQFIQHKESAVWIGNQLRGKQIKYSGNMAVLHGVLYCILGLLGIIFSFIAAIGVITPNWIWLIIGLCIFHVFMVIGFFILAILARKSEPNTG